MSHHLKPDVPGGVTVNGIVPNGWIEYVEIYDEPPQWVIDELEARKAEVRQTREFELRQKRAEKESYTPVIPEVQSYSHRRTKAVSGG